VSVSGFFFAAFTNILGGSSYIATAYLLQGFSASEAGFWRILLAAIVCAPLAFRLRRMPEVARGDVLRMAAVGFFGYAAPLWIGNLGQSMSSATHAALLICIEPVSIMVLSAMFLGEPMTRLKWISAVVGFSGAALIPLQEVSMKSAGPRYWLGDALLILAAVLWGLYTVVGKPVLKKIDSMTFTAVTTLFASFPFIIFAMPAHPVNSFFSAPKEAYAGLVYGSIAVTFIGAWAWNQAVKLVPASQFAHFIFLQPLVGAIYGACFFGERFTTGSALGGVLILASVFGAIRAGSGGRPRGV